METQEFLGNVELFRHLDKEALDDLASRTKLVSFADGPIVKDADPSDGFYVIRFGAAKVTKASDRAETEVVLAILRQGDSFGEIGLIDGLPRTASVVTMQPTECYFLSRDGFMAALEQHPEIARGLLPGLAGMVRSADQWIAHLL